jgi:hypothetical protein
VTVTTAAVVEEVSVSERVLVGADKFAMEVIEAASLRDGLTTPSANARSKAPRTTRSLGSGFIVATP